MLPKSTHRKEFVPRNHRPTKDFHKYARSPIVYFTRAELDLLGGIILQSAKDHGIWGTNLIPFHDLSSFNFLLLEEPWRETIVRTPFKELPLHLVLNPLKIGYWDHHTEIWVISVAKWRLQVGK